ncbi:MAG: hypothetical protein FJ121_02815 [Deltaproteobacteria bacterium]|nr:hypothetical protein [Deltaproteobacteria bacterium]
MPNDLHALNTFEITKIVWNTLAELARTDKALDSKEYFILEGFVGELGTPTSVYEISLNKWKPPQSQVYVVRSDNSFKYIVRKIYYSAISMGLIIPGNISEEIGYRPGAFQFTLEGIKYFSNGFISVDDPGYLGIALKELQKRLPSIDNGKIELLLESQRCIKAGCYRAGMVVLGVANEDMCFALLDSIPLSCNPPPPASPLNSDWNSCNNSMLSFSRRWKPGIRILEEIKNKIRKSAKGETWFQWWEMIPGSLYTLGEAVRIARNTAAHDSNRLFSKAEVALLLSAMPTQLEMLSNITEFLKSPLPHLNPIQI